MNSFEILNKDKIEIFQFSFVSLSSHTSNTVCPRSLDPIYSNLLYKIVQDFLDRYNKLRTIFLRLNESETGKEQQDRVSSQMEGRVII